MRHWSEEGDAVLFEVTLADLVSRDAALVHVAGEIDMSVSARLDAALVRAALGHRAVVLDLGCVSFFSAAGIACIEHVEKALDTGPGALALVCPGNSHPVRVVLRAAGLEQRWPLFSALTAALDRLPPLG